jgi:hypothetical protein
VPVLNALFVIGPDGANTIVRRIRLSGDAPQLPTTVAEIVAPPGGPFAYGTYTLMDELWVPLAFAGDIRRLTGLDSEPLTEMTFGDSTLMPPYDVLLDVSSIGRTPMRLFMSFGDFVGGGNRFGIVELTNGTWSVFEDGEDLWGMNTCVITTGLVDGTERLFALAGQEIFDFRLSDDTLAGSFPLPDTIPTEDASLVLDPSGRLWLGSSGGLWVFAAGVDGLPLLAERVGVSAGRFALREENDTVVVRDDQHHAVRVEVGDDLIAVLERHRRRGVLRPRVARYVVGP